MIAGIFHQGSGLGNQLHRYVATRVLAEEKGLEWGMIAADLFKGKGFMQIDMGKEVTIPYSIEWGTGKVLPAMVDVSMWEEKTMYYNPEINYLEDNTIIDGSFEDTRYFEHRLPDIKEWLKTEPLEVDEGKCVIGFRGGEYTVIPELFLPQEYWDTATRMMRQKYPGISFEVHTDDPETARKFFPIYPIIHDLGRNWRAMRYAKYAIIANSSFYVLPRLLNGGLTISPKYWNRHNTKKWDYPQNYYKQFLHI